MTDELLAHLESGGAFHLNPPGSDRFQAVDDAVKTGWERNQQQLALPSEVKFAVVERTEVEFKNQGSRQAKGEVCGLAEVSGSDWLKGDRARASFFPARSLFLPAENAVAAELSPHGDALDLLLRFRCPTFEIGLDRLPQDAEILLYCDSDDPEALAAFRGLLCAPWRDSSKNRFWPRAGVGPPIDETLAMRSGVGRVLQRLQPPIGGRFMRIPVAAIAPSAASEARLQVRLGRDCGRTSRSLRDVLRLNHAPIWSVRRTATEQIKASSPTTLTLDMQNGLPIKPLVLSCYRRDGNAEWHDRRYSACDPAEQFEVALLANGQAELRFKKPPPFESLRIDYLSWQTPFDVVPSAWLTDATNRHYVAKTGAYEAFSPTQLMFDDIPKGSAGTRAELLAIVWRLLPPPFRKALGDVGAKWGRMVRTRRDWRFVDADDNVRRTEPAIVIELPRFPGPLDPPCLETLAHRIGEYFPHEENITVKF